MILLNETFWSSGLSPSGITAFYIWVIAIAVPTIIVLKLLIDEIDDHKLMQRMVQNYPKLTRYLLEKTIKENGNG